MLWSVWFWGSIFFFSPSSRPIDRFSQPIDHLPFEKQSRVSGGRVPVGREVHTYIPTSSGGTYYRYVHVCIHVHCKYSTCALPTVPWDEIDAGVTLRLKRWFPSCIAGMYKYSKYLAAPSLLYIAAFPPLRWWVVVIASVVWFDLALRVLEVYNR